MHTIFQKGFYYFPMRHNLILFFTICLSSCATYKSTPPLQTSQTQKNKPYHSIYLISNSDEQKKPPFESAEVLIDLLKENESSILWLGNNSIKNGNPDTSTFSNKTELNETLKRRYQFFSQFKGDKYFITGQNEWDKGGRQGFREVQALEYYVEDVLDLGNVYRPDNGCPGPEEIHLSDDVTLLLINTQWFLHNWDRPDSEDGCDVNNEIEFLAELEDAIKRNYNKKIIVAGHHSLTSSGKYGGYFSAKTHLFPLTLANDNLYIPLPGLGSIYVLNRHFLGEHQDISNYKYKRMINSFEEFFSQHENLIYVSGHEQSLEYFRNGNMHLVNSGSFSKSSPINSKKATFVSSDKGFGKIDLYENGDVWLRFYSSESTVDQPLFETLLFSEKPFDKDVFEEKTTDINYTDSTKSMYITKAYEKKKVKPGPLGNNYREEWSTTVDSVRYFDLGQEKGGLIIKKKGGGMQTKSLRLEAGDERQYVLRSIEKFPENAVPLELRGTFAENLIAEQVSAAHPYAAFAIPKLADAAGVYHTNPELVYLPDDPRLGIYRGTFGDGLYLFEERPEKDQRDVKSFGQPKDIISTSDVLEKMMKDGDHQIDQNMVVRSRLFDILIGDWDRHDDQWRWAEFEIDDDIELYRPIPRDRDQAFFWSDGWVMDLISKPFAMPKFQGFHMEIENVNGLSFNARYFDRSFMTEPDLEDWLTICHEIQEKITDDIIETAIRDLPTEIFALHGDTIISKLKHRRDDLEKYAREYYLFLSKEVDVPGTSKRDRFTIERLNDEETKVVAYHISPKKGENKYKFFERTFKTSETNEIRLYGLEDDDIFNLEGTVDNGIKIRIIGGSGEDEIKNNSLVEGIGKKTWVYDTKTKTELNDNSDTKVKTSDRDKDINVYNRKAFQYDLAAPIAFGGFNPDDGIFIGVGGIFQTHGFRKDPFKTSHFIAGTIAPKSASFNVSYKGTFTDIISKWSLVLDAGIFYPSYSDFFYGFGNETQFDDEIIDEDNQYYAARYRQILFNPELFRTSRNKKHRFAIGLRYQSINVRSDLNDSDEEIDRFITQYQQNLNYELFDETRFYMGAYLGYSYDTRDNELYPQNGLLFDFITGYAKSLDQKELDVNFAYSNANISFYYTFGNTLRSTLAARVGGASNNGDYEFYHARKLGGSTNLRGVRKQRFAGDQTFYQNTDLRIRLFSFKSIVLPGDVGLVFFHDVGRVWVEEDPSTPDGKSDFWHRGYGLGAYLAPFGKAAITADYSWSNTSERAFFVRLGFLF